MKYAPISFVPDDILREYGFKATVLRTALLNHLHNSKKPLTVSALLKKTKRLDADTASVYRALRAFRGAQLVRELSLTDAGKSYELIKREHAHHIVCDRCNAIEAIPFCIRNIEATAIEKSKLFKKITDHAISFNGTCKKCIRTVR